VRTRRGRALTKIVERNRAIQRGFSTAIAARRHRDRSRVGGAFARDVDFGVESAEKREFDDGPAAVLPPPAQTTRFKDGRPAVRRAGKNGGTD